MNREVDERKDSVGFFFARAKFWSTHKQNTKL